MTLMEIKAKLRALFSESQYKGFVGRKAVGNTGLISKTRKMPSDDRLDLHDDRDP